MSWGVLYWSSVVQSRDILSWVVAKVVGGWLVDPLFRVGGWLVDPLFIATVYGNLIKVSIRVLLISRLKVIVLVWLLVAAVLWVRVRILVVIGVALKMSASNRSGDNISKYCSVTSKQE